MGKYRDEFVQGLSACVDECRKTLAQVEHVAKSYDGDAKIRAVRNMATTMIKGIDDLFKNVTENKLIFEIEQDIKNAAEEVQTAVENAIGPKKGTKGKENG